MWFEYNIALFLKDFFFCKKLLSLFYVFNYNCLILARNIGISVILLLFLYNLLGCYVLFIYRQNEISTFVSKNLATGNIPLEDLLIIKIPASIYTSIPDQDFEQIEGAFTYQGKVYEMVKQRIANDTLYIYCANNKLQEELIANFSEYVRSHSAGFNGTENNTQQLQKLLNQNYLNVEPLSIDMKVALYDRKDTVYQEFCFSSFFLLKDTPPPRQV